MKTTTTTTTPKNISLFASSSVFLMTALLLCFFTVDVAAQRAIPLLSFITDDVDDDNNMQQQQQQQQKPMITKQKDIDNQLNSETHNNLNNDDDQYNVMDLMSLPKQKDDKNSNNENDNRDRATVPMTSLSGYGDADNQENEKIQGKKDEGKEDQRKVDNGQVSPEVAVQAQATTKVVKVKGEQKSEIAKNQDQQKGSIIQNFTKNTDSNSASNEFYKSTCNAKANAYWAGASCACKAGYFKEYQYLATNTYNDASYECVKAFGKMVKVQQLQEDDANNQSKQTRSNLQDQNQVNSPRFYNLTDQLFNQRHAMTKQVDQKLNQIKQQNEGEQVVNIPLVYSLRAEIDQGVEQQDNVDEADEADAADGADGEYYKEKADLNDEVDNQVANQIESSQAGDEQGDRKGERDESQKEGINGNQSGQADNVNNDERNNKADVSNAGIIDNQPSNLNSTTYTTPNVSNSPIYIPSAYLQTIFPSTPTQTANPASKPAPTSKPIPTSTPAPTPTPQLTQQDTTIPTIATETTPVPTSAPTPASTSTPIPIPISTPTPILTPTPTPIPTPTPQPNPTQTPTPQPTPTSVTAPKYSSDPLPTPALIQNPITVPPTQTAVHPPTPNLTLVGLPMSSSRSVFVTLQTPMDFTFGSDRQMQEFMRVDIPTPTQFNMPSSTFCSQTPQALNRFECLLLYNNDLPNEEFKVDFSYDHKGQTGKVTATVNTLKQNASTRSLRRSNPR